MKNLEFWGEFLQVCLEKHFLACGKISKFFKNGRIFFEFLYFLMNFEEIFCKKFRIMVFLFFSCGKIMVFFENVRIFLNFWFFFSIKNHKIWKTHRKLGILMISFTGMLEMTSSTLMSHSHPRVGHEKEVGLERRFLSSWRLFSIGNQEWVTRVQFDVQSLSLPMHTTLPQLTHHRVRLDLDTNQ